MKQSKTIKQKTLIYVVTPGLNEKGFGHSESVVVGGTVQWNELMAYYNN